MNHFSWGANKWELREDIYLKKFLVVSHKWTQLWVSFLFQDDVEVVYEKLNERVQDLR